MSLTHEQKTTVANETPTRSWWRFLRFPLIVLVLFGSIFAIPWVCVALDFSPEGAAMPFMMTQFLAPMAAVLLLVLWWIFFSGTPWMVRLCGVLLVAVLIGGFFYSLRDFQLTMGRVSLVPRIDFTWDPSAEDKLAQESKREGSIADTLPIIDATVGPEDFPAYRGPKTDGVITHAKVEWKTPLEVLWRKPCPGGYSGVAVAGNIAVTLQQRVKEKKEVVVCYDRATGAHRWFYAYDAYHKDVMGDGPRSTPTIHDNHVYSIGATGQMVCLTAEGKLVWTHNILDDAKAKNIKWGMAGSPLIVDDLVIANAGIDPEAPAGSCLIAYEQANGKIRWRTGNRKAGYSSPQLAVLGGVPQILLFDGAGLASYDPKTGKELWQFPWITDFEMNSIQPVVLGNDRVFISSEVQNGGALLRIKAPDNDKSSWTVETVWQNNKLAARYANPVTDGKLIFGLHNLGGILTCLDAADGSVKWRGEREGPGQLLLVDGRLLVINGDTGELAVLEADAQHHKELMRQPAFEKNDKTWNTPALAGNQLFVRNQIEIVCLKLPRR